MRLKATILTIAFLFFASTGLVMAKRQDSPGAVYTMTNSEQGNEVLVFNRSADGLLSPAGAFETFGLGTGGGLGNQGGVLLTSDNAHTFANERPIEVYDGILQCFLFGSSSKSI